MECFADSAICQRILRCLLCSCGFCAWLNLWIMMNQAWYTCQKKKNQLKLTQQLEPLWRHQLLSNQLLSIACSTSLLPHTWIKIFWFSFFAAEWTTSANSECLKPQHAQGKIWVLKSDLPVRNSELWKKVQIKVGTFKGTNRYLLLTMSFLFSLTSVRVFGWKWLTALGKRNDVYPYHSLCLFSIFKEEYYREYESFNCRLRNEHDYKWFLVNWQIAPI